MFSETKFAKTETFSPRLNFPKRYQNFFPIPNFLKPILKPFFKDQKKSILETLLRLKLSNNFDNFGRGTQPRNICLPLAPIWQFFPIFGNFLSETTFYETETETPKQLAKVSKLRSLQTEMSHSDLVPRVGEIEDIAVTSFVSKVWLRGTC